MMISELQSGIKNALGILIIIANKFPELLVLKKSARHSMFPRLVVASVRTKGDGWL
jgi:hypothetical protein